MTDVDDKPEPEPVRGVALGRPTSSIPPANRTWMSVSQLMRDRALRSAVAALAGTETTLDEVLDLADHFTQYIRVGRGRPTVAQGEQLR